MLRKPAISLCGTVVTCQDDMPTHLVQELNVCTVEDLKPAISLRGTVVTCQDDIPMH